MKRSTSGLVAGALALVIVAGPAAAADAATVTVRVEGVARTLVPRTTVETTDRPVRKQDDASQACPGTSAGGALELATDGRWGGSYDPSFGQSVERIRGESYPLAGPEPRYWSLWVNGVPSESGACAKELSEGDEVLFFVDCYGPGCVNPVPLRLSVPERVAPGESFEVRVQELAASGAAAPSAGARVRAGDVVAQTDAEGRVELEAPESRRRVRIRVTKPNTVRVAETVRVGVAPETSIARISDGEVFAAEEAPRRLRGRVEPDVALRGVKLRLTRRAGGRCSTWSPTRERFRATRCGRGTWFRIGANASWFYRLPERLEGGRYELGAKAIDRAGNRGEPTTVSFRVR